MFGVLIVSLRCIYKSSVTVKHFCTIKYAVLKKEKKAELTNGYEALPLCKPLSYIEIQYVMVILSFQNALQHLNYPPFYVPRQVTDGGALDKLDLLPVNPAEDRAIETDGVSVADVSWVVLAQWG